MNSKEKRYKLIPLRIGASVLIAAYLFVVCDLTYDEIYNDFRYIFGYAPRDYLGSYLRDYEFAVTVIICVGIFIISSLFIWKLFKLKWRLAAAGFFIILIVCGAEFNKHQENLLEINELEGTYKEEVNLTVYEPFRENTLAKSLNGESALKLGGNLPRLDGATALYPLYAAFARAVYPVADYKAYDKDGGVICSKTSGAFDNLLGGKADLIFIMGVSREQRKQAEELGLELTLTPIGKEAFVFFVNKRNSVSNLTVENIKGIYSGNITNWRGVGGDNAQILAYQRPDVSGSQIMLKEIMGDTPIIEAPYPMYLNGMLGMYNAVAYKNHKNALGYSFLYYINDMIAENRIKFLSINGVPPTAANIASGAYPFAHNFYAVTVARKTETEAERTNNTKKLIEWILSPQGQELVEKTGYVPLGQTNS